MGVSVAVCALTYQRLDGLRRLLEGLGKQRFTDAAPDLRIIVVDNDPAGGARETCTRLSETLPWPLQYVIEPQRGIALARNTALDHARDADWIAFIDDDEVPEPNWLDELLRVQRVCNADVVGGPVLPHVPEETPTWLIDGGFFNRQRHATGARLPHCFTGNVLFRSRILDELRLRFDERWRLTGAEDRAFFQTIGMAGYTIVWADDAVVTEWLPATRANAKWVAHRYFRVGNTTTLVQCDLRGRWRMTPILAAKAGVWLLIGLGRFAWGLLRGRSERCWGRCSFAYGVGIFAGLAGFKYEEYRRVHSV